jgi:hypothetical protein
MGRAAVGMAELVEHWTVAGDERDLIPGKRGATRLGFALLLKLYRATAASHGAARSSRAKLWTTWRSR